MSATQDQPPLRGIARSIDDLFSRGERRPAPPRPSAPSERADGSGPEAAQASGPPPAAATTPEPEADEEYVPPPPPAEFSLDGVEWGALPRDAGLADLRDVGEGAGGEVEAAGAEADAWSDDAFSFDLIPEAHEAIPSVPEGEPTPEGDGTARPVGSAPFPRLEDADLIDEVELLGPGHDRELPPAPPAFPASGEIHDIAEGPLLDPDVLVDEISGPGGQAPPVDVEAERGERVRTAAASLAQAVDAFTAGGAPDMVGLSRRIRDESMTLREEHALDPIADAVERLVRAAPPDDVDHPALALGRLLATPGVAVRISSRLATTRDERRRDELAEACRRIGSEAAEAVAAALAEAEDRSARRNLAAALGSMGEEGMRQAEAMMKDGRFWVVRNGVSILGEIGGERAVEHLTVTLAHEEAAVRRETLMALARVGGEGATLLVLGKLEDPDPDVRITAVRAVGAMASERAVRTLLARLDEEHDEEVLAEVLRALGQLRDPGAVPAIEKRAVGSFFSRPPSRVRVAAYRALAAIGSPHARSLIEAAAEDRDPEVRQVARALLAGRS